MATCITMRYNRGMTHTILLFPDKIKMNIFQVEPEEGPGSKNAQVNVSGSQTLTLVCGILGVSALYIDGSYSSVPLDRTFKAYIAFSFLLLFIAVVLILVCTIGMSHYRISQVKAPFFPNDVLQ